MHEEMSPEIDFIWSGMGESPYQEREQWTDGCNLLTIKPGVALTYDRNTFTEKAFRNKGYDVIHSSDFLKMVAEENKRPEDIQNTIITLSSSELSRARGGTHCMSFPVARIPKNKQNV
jgi:arginine deiminase